MAHHLVVGAGGIGRHTAAALLERGHTVVLASRSGTDPGIPEVESLALDARDADALTAASRGAASIVNATNPRSYAHWARDWPPVANAVLAAAERSGASLVTVSNLYAYGRVDAPMTEQTPIAPNGPKGMVRGWMWEQAYAGHRAGRLRATELRASDYFGPEASQGMSYLQDYVIGKVLGGKAIRLPMGDPDVLHSWTYLPDIGRLAATLATDERSWGHAWHVPTTAPLTMAQVAVQTAALVDRPAPGVGRIPGWVMAMGKVSPFIRSLDETRHQFERPFVLDSSLTEITFDLRPTPWSEALAATVHALISERASVPAR